MNPVPFHNSIQLKKLKLSDAEDLFPVFNDPDVVKYLPQTRHEDVKQTTDFLFFLLEEAKKGNSYIWKITDKQKEKDDAIGLIDLVSISKNGHTGSLAYVVRKSCWGKGVASYSVQQAIFYVFRQTVMRTVYAPVVSRNTASKHVLIKNGFELDHIKPVCVNFDGQDDLVEVLRINRKDFQKHIHGYWI